MSAPNYHNQVDSDLFSRLGHPGQYYKVQIVNNATVNFTGSNYGYGAIMLGESGTTGTASLSGGGEVDLAKLNIKEIYEFSVAKVTCNAKDVYVFKRQQ